MSGAQSGDQMPCVGIANKKLNPAVAKSDSMKGRFSSNLYSTPQSGSNRCLCFTI